MTAVRSEAATFDLDALEVEDEHKPPFRFAYRGDTFDLPVAAAMPWQDQVQLEKAGQLESLRLIMGDVQFERFRMLPMSAGRLGKLIEAWLKYQGLKPGESAASSRS